MLILGAYDNRGTEFIIAFMDNWPENIQDVEVFITTAVQQAVTVHVSAPRYPAISNETFTVTAGNVEKKIYDKFIRVQGSVAETTKAMYITASDEIVVFVNNKERFSADAYLALPTDILAQEYFAVSHSPSKYAPQFMVIGVFDNTAVTITVRGGINWNGNRADGTTIHETINKFDTYQFQANNNTASNTFNDLSGSRIVADKSIAVISGNRRTTVGDGTSSDHLAEMLPSVNRWGTTFITVSIPLRTIGDVFRFVAANDSTTVTFDGDCAHISSFTLDSGGVKTQNISSQTNCLITSTKAIMVVQIVQSQISSSETSDPAMIYIPPVNQYAADYTFSTPLYETATNVPYYNYFMFIVKTADKDGLRLDGNLPDLSNSTVVQGTEYTGGYFFVASGTHTVNHIDPTKVFCGFLYGKERFETYALPIGMRMGKINVSTNDIFVFFKIRYMYT